MEQLRSRGEKTEAQLRRSGEMLQLVIDNIPQRVFWKDRNRVYVGCNRAFAKDVGLDDTSQVAGKTNLDLSLCEQDIESYAKTECAVIDTNKPLLGIEELFHKPDGTTAWLRTNLVPLHGNDAEVSGLLVTYEDVTGQRATLRELAESEQRYRMLFENANDAVFIADRDFNIIDANRKTCEILGYSKSELLTMKTPALQPPEMQTGAQRGAALVETEALHVDGRVINVEVSLSSFTSSGSTLYLAIARDITEQKNTMERLNAREETLRSIFNAAVEPMLLLDTDGVILNLNQTAATRFEAETDELIGRNSYEFVDSDTAALRRKNADFVIHWSMPVRFEEKKGDTVFEITINPVFGSDGRVTRLAVFSRDTTVQKRRELKLETDELKYRTVFNHFTCAAVLFDSEVGIIREVNNQLERLLERSAGEITGMHFSELFCAGFLHDCQEMLDRATEEENLLETILATLETKNGEKKEVIVSVRNMWIANKCYLLATVQEKRQLESLLKSRDKKKR